MPHKLTLYPLKGYDKAARKVATLLEQAFKLKPVENSAIFYAALAQQGRIPGDYQSGLNIKLNPKQSVEEACQLIFKHLLKSLKANEAGTIEDIDSEFLHDFRVAVRRTRAAFSVFKKVLPESIVQQYAPFFAWLGQVTGPTRDLDVYLLNYQHYKQVLPPTLHDELTPFYHFLKRKQKQAQQKMAEQLQSDRYKQQIVAWEEFLNSAKLFKTKDSGDIKTLADQRIWKMYKRLLKEGSLIDDESPAESLHDLRKTSKKLRYLMEFFQTLYPEDKIKPCIRALKDFQSVLGDFQDYEVQEVSIKQFSDEMLAEGADSNTILAMGVLIQYLDTLKVAARRDFAHQFERFKGAQNHKHFQKLFAGKGSGDKA
ncbi:CHAD domain-containing protein [methane-oxidizing endosymbiont of Gigantopelta aegis]|uniref:CHAD domain-containing protein n=1 Tax=methane-oxidizing endosymbiont of Gigantopelta aegis TaxID=2794938 RepID=UPI0018DBF5CD|nr:CHAD domain-containing protein [methane-oxidizing endosymbiont of Gigantopelta aegis]